MIHNKWKFIAFILIGLYCTSCEPQQTKPGQPDIVAYEKIKFGLKEASYLKQYKDSSAIIDNSVYKLSPFFIPGDHRLYMLQLLSQERSYEYIQTTVANDMKTLVSKIISLYGNPTVYLKPLDIEHSDANKVNWQCRWLLPNKSIQIGIARLSDKKTFFEDPRTYAAVCEIINKPLKKIADTQLIYTSF